jgi:hypothetical protein
MCKKASSCGSMETTADCVAQAKALYCPGGVDQYCGGGMTFQPSKASACLDALDALACAAMATIPTPCTPEVLCTSPGGSTPTPASGETCHAVIPGRTDTDNCDPKASLCFAAGKPSSCANKALCVGDGTGMTCAAPCTVDADCLSVGTGLLCLQGCAVGILNGFCITPKIRTKLMETECSDSKYPDTTGTAGWAL